MKPFRKNVALAIDGGGIRGIIVSRALVQLETYLGTSLHNLVSLTAGTSTGSIISAAIAAGVDTNDILNLYVQMGPIIFKRTLRSFLFPLSRYKYDSLALESALNSAFSGQLMGDYWVGDQPKDVVITVFDMLENRTRFIKPWKTEYADWPIAKAVLASSSVPTIFPIVDGRYADGGVGSYSNPCYLAAYEMMNCLGWRPEESTLISIGTGRAPHRFRPERTKRMHAWDWIFPVLDAFLSSADDQQVHLVNMFYPSLDFRRYQVDLSAPIAMDDVSSISRMLVYGDELGRKIIQDQTDPILKVLPSRASDYNNSNRKTIFL